MSCLPCFWILVALLFFLTCGARGACGTHGARGACGVCGAREARFDIKREDMCGVCANKNPTRSLCLFA